MSKDRQYTYFKRSDFDCKHTGRNEMKHNFILRLDALRDICGFSFIINSGYRDPSHPEEARKAQPGQHAHGIAADIRVNGGAQRMAVVRNALAMGFTGIGVANTFVHLDLRTSEPMLWKY